MPKSSKPVDDTAVQPKVVPVVQPPSFPDKVNAYLEKEMENLRTKQTTIQGEIDKKAKETATLRETLLVVNGALQGIQHVRSFILEEGAPSSTSSSSATTVVS